LAQTLFPELPNHEIKTTIIITSIGTNKGEGPLSTLTSSSGSLDKSFGAIRRINATAKMRTTFEV
jgi:hypothetical protein